jgi:hypothetical protein
MDKEKLQQLGYLAKAELELVLATIREKGGKRFMKAYLIAGFMVFAAYMGVYAPPQKKALMLARKIAAAKAMFDSGAQYSELRASLASAYAQLPPLKDKDQWLSNSMVDSLRSESLTPLSFRPIVEIETAGLITQSSSVELAAKFGEFYAWLVKVENAKPLMHVKMLEIGKKDEPIGMNAINCDVQTVIPKRRLN